MAISLSNIVRVLPGVLKVSGSALDLNGLILTDSAYAPVGSVLSFSNAADVAAYFGSESIEAKMSPWYFSGYNNASRTPGRLLFAGFSDKSVPAFLRSGSMASVTPEELSVLGGTLTLTINGKQVSSSNIDLSGVKSFADVAQKVSNGLNVDGKNAVSVVFDTATKTLVITTASTGKGATLSYPDSEAGGLATGLMLTAPLGAVLSQGAQDMDIPGLMTSILEQDQNWAAFTTAFMPTGEQALNFAKWTSAQDKRFAYVLLDSGDKAVVSGSADALAAPVIAAEYAGTVPVYGRQAHGAGVLGYVASLNFNQRRGRRNLAFRVQPGLEVMVTRNAEYSALMANGYNFYGNYAQNRITTNQWYPGSVTGDYKWLDSCLGQMWLNARLQGDIITLFQSEIYLPYAADGRAAIETAMLSTIEQFKEWGGITPGTTLGDSQLIAIKNATGMDPTSVLNSKGYLIYIGEFTATMRAERTSPEVYLWYCDGGFIQKLYINAIEVQ
ncbi:hypothetical protein ABW11_21035 [Pluralibacter gergoviae]|uniref:DUF3383 domain-containing protein n=1 Tax=Pluralibacter gergoviae TaxID=61647 RepID=UPI0006517936|nr:DUF3383 domain-containing protein [Pluralibacter gergoviae]KMK23098.1 hypothetical protein ABW11_21035 [Pluralibacter gergoviae]